MRATISNVNIRGCEPKNGKGGDYLLAIVLFQSVPKNFLIHLPYVSIYQSDIFSRF